MYARLIKLKYYATLFVLLWVQFDSITMRGKFISLFPLSQNQTAYTYYLTKTVYKYTISLLNLQWKKRITLFFKDIFSKWEQVHKVLLNHSPLPKQLVKIFVQL